MSRLSLRRLVQMIRKEFRQLRRDPRVVAVMLISPLVQLLVFGYAVTTDVRNVPTIVLDRDWTAQSRAVADALTASGYFRLAAYAHEPRDLVRALDRGSALIAIDIPRGFGRLLAQGSPAPLQVLVDGTSANTANVASGYVALIARHAADQSAAGAGLPASNVALNFEPRVWYNPGLEARLWYVPGTAGVIIVNLCLILTALAVVREREEGTLEQLLVTPIRPLEIIVGKTVPVAAIVMIDVAMVAAAGALLFHVPLRGSLLVFGSSALLFVLAGLGAGLLLSTVAHTQQQASMSMALVMMPVNMLSGFIFPITSMPRVVQWLTLINPLRYEIDVLRGVFLRGVGLDVLWPQFAVLAVMSVALLLVAARRFHRTL
ncbi:MAG TPA: ABC transporter permease [Gemmatimonadales bacterium]|nr:ABC transporter permease [Gemmatimonadales bacterium]